MPMRLDASGDASDDATLAKPHQARLLHPPGRPGGGVHHLDVEGGEFGADGVGLGPVLGGARGDAFGDQAVDPRRQRLIHPAAQPDRGIGLQEADQRPARQQLALGARALRLAAALQPLGEGEQFGVGLGRVQVVVQGLEERRRGPRLSASTSLVRCSAP